MRPKMKNHYRAHQLSVWLRLVPELHRAGMEDVDSRHNLFRGHSDPNLYDGSVRPDPLSRISEEFKRKNVTTEPPTTTDYNAATCVSYIQTTNLQNINNTGIDTLANLDAAGYVIKISIPRNENVNNKESFHYLPYLWNNMAKFENQYIMYIIEVLFNESSMIEVFLWDLCFIIPFIDSQRIERDFERYR